MWGSLDKKIPNIPTDLESLMLVYLIMKGQRPYRVPMSKFDKYKTLVK
jgi:hypothetical protein